MTRVNAAELSEATTRLIERTWHCSRPKPRASAMGLSPDESLASKRRRELRRMLAEDDELRRATDRAWMSL